jgi:hypothetical protein
MNKSYIKPEVIKEECLERNFVYADVRDQVTPGCTTLVKKIEIKDGEAKLT